ncbi:hypothetical protein NVP1187O_065 [Vibrio phage 1.187.O._10N.286.49.F1]|nr:hypothetical protein NVP1187O_065 [Vibrio phage 1.187.O._10N.286.49.F1]
MENEVEIFYEGNLVTRKEAVEQGLKNYFTGKSCKHGHVETRQTCSGQCNQCKRLRTQKWRDKPESERYQNEKVSKELPTQDHLKSVLDYDPVTGKIYWKLRPMRPTENERSYRAWRTRWEGKEAGSQHYANGYLEIRFEDGKLHKVHRVIWKIMTGEDPTLPIDHVNSIPWDNRWCNLRQATNQENARNSRSFSRNGYKGVTEAIDNTWTVNWCVADQNFYKQGFNTSEMAARYYDKVVKELYGDFAKLNFQEDKEESGSD